MPWYSRWLPNAQEDVSKVAVQPSFRDNPQSTAANHWLSRLKQDRTLVQAQIGHDHTVYQSVVLGFDTKQQRLLIDEPFPRPDRVRNGQQVRLTVPAGQHLIQVSGRIVAIKDNDDLTYYALTLPKRLEQKPRRHDIRVILPKDNGCSLRFDTPNRQRHYATLVNLSATGLRLCVVGNMAGELRPDQLLGQCELQLNGSRSIFCELRVRNFSFQRSPYRHTMIGAQIVGLTDHFQGVLLDFCRQHMDRDSAGWSH